MAKRLTVIVISAVLSMLVPALPAWADTTLCAGFSTCAQAGYSIRDYEAAYNGSYWDMDAGHNCTNYVAYVLELNGARRPSNPALGDAYTWAERAHLNGFRVDNVPVVGSVAWWTKDAGRGPLGHVAYVESVTADSITISEDSYPDGPFRYEIVSRSGTGQPTGYIHFRDLGLRTMLGRNWFLSNYLDSRNGQVVFSFGRPGDVALAGDWDGNGTVTPGVRRSNVFYLSNSPNGGSAFSFSYGDTGDVPIVGNWDGYAGDTIGVRRGNVFYLSNYLDSRDAQTVFPYGNSTDLPIIGNWDGYAGDTIGVRRGNVFHLSNYLDSRNSQIAFPYGDVGDTPVVGNWDRVGGDTVAVIK